MPLRSVSFDALDIEDEASFKHVALYHRLKKKLAESNHKFYVPGVGTKLSWDRVLFLNLTFWSGQEEAEVLCAESIPADVVTHVAWHRIVGHQLAAISPPGPPSAWALLFAESIASAFDLYLVGRLIQNAPDSDFIATQVPIMSETAREAGLPDDDFEKLLLGVHADPESAFESLRELLFDVTTALLTCRDIVESQAVFERWQDHPLGSLLHHYQLSNWILYARAYADVSPVEKLRDLDETLRKAPGALDWLVRHWVDR